jgi:SNF2 family DNA or RNA helicase/Holliday junction resolvase
MPDVRGCVFADDMGLGKTLQLLAFVHWYLDQPDACDPVLIVAPVSLLENWRNEIAKFFLPHAREPLILYGKALSEVRLDKAGVDRALLEKGLTRFLRPDWLGGARIVLTTYETLRDQEFSLSATRWAIMICDEAQKIKTPSALVTRAAKKQNVAFKIACTGTPVENSLTDLWCLFDYVQPGLLGPLNQFGRSYSRPIEAQTAGQKAAVERLRALIEPQVLRRTKKEVADLPPKILDLACADLPISPRQLALYASVVDDYQALRQAMEQAPDRKAGGAALLSMLHRLRNICADPRDEGLRASPIVALDDYCRISPKMRWLMERLAAVQAAGEKVIVFTEFRNIQRLLQHLIGKRFGIRVSVVNGDTGVGTAASDSSRQAIIDAFQGKPGFNVIILSTTAVGFGVNIQAANHVVHFTRPWNPAKEDQATDRAYRIGQEKTVHVYCPTVTAQGFETFEKKLNDLLDIKRRLAGDMLNGYDDIGAGDWEGLSAPGGTAIPVATRIGVEHLTSMEPVTFESLCARLWSLEGYTVYRTPASGDGGVDVVAFRGEVGALIQCKTTSDANRALGWEGVRDVVAGAAAYRTIHPTVRFRLIAATNQAFNADAREQAAINGVQLVDRAYFAERLSKYEVGTNDL